MPNWLKPTGGFGIGLQSGFMVSDEITMLSKCDTDAKGREVILETPRRGGNIDVKECSRKECGTEVKIRLDMMEFMSKRYGGIQEDDDKNKDLFNPASFSSVTFKIIGQYIREVIPGAMFAVILTDKANMMTQRIQYPLYRELAKAGELDISSNPSDRYTVVRMANGTYTAVWDKKDAAMFGFLYDYDSGDDDDSDDGHGKKEEIRLRTEMEKPLSAKEYKDALLGHYRMVLTKKPQYQYANIKTCYKNIAAQLPQKTEGEAEVLDAIPFNLYVFADFMAPKVKECLTVDREKFRKDFDVEKKVAEIFQWWLAKEFDALMKKYPVSEISDAHPLLSRQDVFVVAMNSRDWKNKAKEEWVGKVWKASKPGTADFTISRGIHVEGGSIKNGFAITKDKDTITFEEFAFLLWELKKRCIAVKYSVGQETEEMADKEIRAAEDFKSYLGGLPSDVKDIVILSEVAAMGEANIDVLINIVKCLLKPKGYINLRAPSGIVVLYGWEEAKVLNSDAMKESFVKQCAWLHKEYPGNIRVIMPPIDEYKELHVREVPFNMEKGAGEGCEEYDSCIISPIAPTAAKTDMEMKKKLDVCNRENYETFVNVVTGDTTYGKLLDWVVEHQCTHGMYTRENIDEAYRRLLRQIYDKDGALSDGQ